ncbi:MAG: hypothetical protein EPO16_06915 [Dehalococcoidia bacterium]|nr:MAG: hypothetical protein EPO16_06915 [Dehalococcoidia bacterium]
MHKRTFGAAIGLTLVATLAVACTSKDEEKATPTASAPVATQTVTSGATTTASPAPAAELVWPEKWRKGTQPILGSIKNAPARVTPTPLPAGVTATPAPPAATPPAAQKVPIVFYVDTVTSGAGESPFNVDATIGCARTSMFSRGMRIVWRLTAYDNTGTELQPATIESLVLKVAGKDATFRYGRHGDAGWFWTATYDVPMETPLGTLDWTVEAKTKSGATATYKEIAAFTAPGAERVMVDGSKTSTDSRTMIVN